MRQYGDFLFNLCTVFKNIFYVDIRDAIKNITGYGVSARMAKIY